MTKKTEGVKLDRVGVIRREFADKNKVLNKVGNKQNVVKTKRR